MSPTADQVFDSGSYTSADLDEAPVKLGRPPMARTRPSASITTIALSSRARFSEPVRSHTGVVGRSSLLPMLRAAAAIAASNRATIAIVARSSDRRVAEADRPGRPRLDDRATGRDAAARPSAHAQGQCQRRLQARPSARGVENGPEHALEVERPAHAGCPPNAVARSPASTAARRARVA